MRLPLLVKGENFFNKLLSLLIKGVNKALDFFNINVDRYVDVETLISAVTSPDPMFLGVALLTIVIAKAIYHMPELGRKCRNCASHGISQWVLPGKSCPRCGHPC